MLSWVLACFWSPQRRDCEINKVGGEVFMTLLARKLTFLFHYVDGSMDKVLEL